MPAGQPKVTGNGRHLYKVLEGKLEENRFCWCDTHKWGDNLIYV